MARVRYRVVESRRVKEIVLDFEDLGSVVTSVKLPAAVKAGLAEYARQRGLTLSDLLRLAVLYTFQRLGDFDEWLRGNPWLLDAGVRELGRLVTEALDRW